MDVHSFRHLGVRLPGNDPTAGKISQIRIDGFLRVPISGFDDTLIFRLTAVKTIMPTYTLQIWTMWTGYVYCVFVMVVQIELELKCKNSTIKR